MAILNKYKKPVQYLRIINDKFYDFVLSMDKSETVIIDSGLTVDGLSGYINFTLDECVSGDSFVSLNTYTWENAVNEGAELKDIGFTGMDNGLILFDKDTITDEEFYKLLTESLITVESGDTRMHVYPVSGNTKAYTYDYEYVKNQYIALKGGFLQGVFKLDGFNYQILPQYIDDSIHVEFVLRPKNYVTDNGTLNNNYPENKGIFFYMGTRAENKFAVLNGADISMYPDREVISGSTCLNYFLESYLLDLSGDTTISGGTIISGETVSGFTLSSITITDSEGNPVNMEAPLEISTDNKYLLFDRTPSGYTVDKWSEVEDAEFILQLDNNLIKDNMYLLMDRTPSGYTVDKIMALRASGLTVTLASGVTSAETSYADYNITDDIKNNAFALQIHDDGSIGYKYLVLDCDSETGWSIKEERTFPNIVKDNEWSTINVRFQILNGELDDCGVPYSTRKMKIYIYVNGYLKLVSQELDEFSFTRLDESYTKQECVPFNISLGGGTQGLAECIWTNYKEMFPKVLPLEENFAGTFIGDIKSFKIYSEPLQYNQIKNNYLFERLNY